MPTATPLLGATPLTAFAAAWDLGAPHDMTPVAARDPLGASPGTMLADVPPAAPSVAGVPCAGSPWCHSQHVTCSHTASSEAVLLQSED
ncbi:hypothetical protein GUJ93_ZPchr0001g32032 [Zizania palustris]|uniref:Uncharacterized protein n=1 Tax=Zizania palustris TaxID=103762 RepID=A0A8J5VAT7_ZIZPA|nr:hypothetical protein GUJ93_ZPchr0001g32032 [Zizania palustris]